MAVRKVKGKKSDIDGAVEEENAIQKFGVYPYGFKKIESMNATVRIAKCNNGCGGGFEEIINLYVDPNGRLIEPYTSKNNKSINMTDKNEVHPDNVEKKEYAYWGGSPKEHSAQYRHKKKARAIKRSKLHKSKNR